MTVCSVGLTLSSSSVANQKKKSVIFCIQCTVWFFSCPIYFVPYHFAFTIWDWLPFAILDKFKKLLAIDSLQKVPENWSASNSSIDQISIIFTLSQRNILN